MTGITGTIPALTGVDVPRLPVMIDAQVASL
jgi:hypothetical protein